MPQPPRSSVPTGQPPKTGALLDAVIAISTDLDLPSVLKRVVESAAEVTDATYGALGVIGGDGELVELITTGINARTRDLIGRLPSGRGILGLLLDQPEPMRMDDLRVHPQAAGFPPHHPLMRSFLGVPIRIRGTVFGNLYLTEKVGGLSFTAEDETLVLSLASAAGVVIDNARSYGLSERRRKWLEASAELADALHPPINLSDALRCIATGARTASGALGACIVRLPGPDDPVMTSLDGMTAEEIEPALFEIAEAARREQVVVRLKVSGREAVVLPLRAHLAEPGVLVTLFDDAHSPAFEDRELLEAFADQAGLALDRAQAVNDREQLALVSERNRIARDLHDVVMQRLFATGLRLESLRASATTPEAVERLDLTVDEINQTINEIRSTIFALRTQS